MKPSQTVVIIMGPPTSARSIEISNPDDKFLYNLKNREIALKKAKKVENVKVVSRTEKGKLVGLWLAKK